MLRVSSDAGIAIGPLLFIIAILGILAAAITAGSGSFVSGTTGERNRTLASAAIEVGQNLKVGMDRVVGGGTDPASVVINPVNTSNAVDLFAPAGGGVTAPATTMANQTSDVWYYPLGDFKNMGTTNTERLAVIKVGSGVCDEVNLRVNGLATTPAVNDVGDFTAATVASGNINTNWPSQLAGKPTGCVNNNNTTAAGYWFYQVLAIR